MFRLRSNQSSRFFWLTGSASLVLTLFLAVTVLCSPALAAKKKNNKKKKAESGIMKTDIRAFDKVFTRVGNVDDDLSGTEKSMRVARRNLNGALELRKGTPLTDGISELHKRGQGKLKVVMEKGNIPKLKAEDGLPTNVMQAVSSVNALSGTLGGSMSTLQNASKQSTELVKATANFPSMLKSEFKKDNNVLATLLKLPKASKALSHNMALTKALPDRATEVTASATNVLTAVSGKSSNNKSNKRAQAGKNKKGAKSKGK